MKVPVKFYFAALAFSVTIISCQKRVTKVDPAFEGEWIAEGVNQGEEYHLFIDENGRGVYEKFEFDQGVLFVEGVFRLDDDQMSINNTVLKVQNYPAPVEDAVTTPDFAEEKSWMMTANNRKFYRD